MTTSKNKKLEKAKKFYNDNQPYILLQRRITRAMEKARKGGKKVFLLKNLVSLKIGDFTLPEPSRMNSLGQKGKRFDVEGNKTLTKKFRNLSLKGKLSSFFKFKDIYPAIAKNIGIEEGNEVVALNDHLILHENDCSDLQPPHIDAPEISTTDIHGSIHEGHGKGFSGFLSITKGSLCIYNFSDTYELTGPEIVDLNPGDVLIVPYGIVHGGNRNTTGERSWKLFTDVNSGSTPSSTSQLWAIDGKGWTPIQPKG